MLQRLRSDFTTYGLPLLLAIVLVVLAVFMPIPFVRSAPGSTYDALGKVDGSAVVNVEAKNSYQTYDTSGELRILTVSQWGGPYGKLEWLDALRSLWDRSIVITPTEFLFAPNIDPNQVAQESQIQFQSAESAAIAAAMAYLGYPVSTDLLVATVMTDKPVSKALMLGDQVIQINGESTQAFDDVVRILEQVSPGDDVNVTVKRGKETLIQTFSTFADTETQKARMGVNILSIYRGPMPITFGLGGVGGPSAGLAFALSIVDQLTPGDLLAERDVSVTGEIGIDGSVGPIGGVKQKVSAAARAGSTILLLPRDNCRDLPDQLPEGLQVVPVSSLTEALAALASETPEKLPVCQ